MGSGVNIERVVITILSAELCISPVF